MSERSRVQASWWAPFRSLVVHPAQHVRASRRDLGIVEAHGTIYGVVIRDLGQHALDGAIR